jgi:hypothetical protein
VRAPAGLTEATLNRLHATLADVPAAERPHFGRIAKQLGLSATEVTVGVWQLVEAGRLDKVTLRPPQRILRGRPYCRHPDRCSAGRSGPCANACNPADPATPAPKAAPRCGAASATAGWPSPRPSIVNRGGAAPSCRRKLGSVPFDESDG